MFIIIQEYSGAVDPQTHQVHARSKPSAFILAAFPPCLSLHYLGGW